MAIGGTGRINIPDELPTYDPDPGYGSTDTTAAEMEAPLERSINIKPVLGGVILTESVYHPVRGYANRERVFTDPMKFVEFVSDYTLSAFASEED